MQGVQRHKVIKSYKKKVTEIKVKKKTRRKGKKITERLKGI